MSKRRELTVLLSLSFFFASQVHSATSNTSGEGTGEAGGAFSSLIQAGEANLFTGTLTHSVPLVIPPGRAALTPELTLVYSSDGGEGPFGLGWSLPFLGSVERSTKHGVPRCTGAYTKDFTLHLAGGSAELRETSPGSDVYRPETDESFTEARLVNVVPGVNDKKYWVVTERSGTEYTFGEIEGARLFTTLDKFLYYVPEITPPGCEFESVWALTRIEDVNGNTIQITYTKDQGSLFPLTIEYGGNAGVGGAAAIEHPFKIDFATQTRSDHKLSYRRGVKERLEKRVNTITTQVKSAPGGSFSTVLTYTLTYAASQSGSRSLLQSVAAQAPSSGVLPTQSFEYLPDFFTDTADPIEWQQSSPKLRDSDGNGAVFRTMMDANGDGFTDWINAKEGGGNAWEIHYGTKDGLVGSELKTWEFSQSGPIVDDRIEKMNSGKVERTVWDVTGDGIIDFVDSNDTTSWDVYPGVCDDDGGSFQCFFSDAAHNFTGTVSKFSSDPTAGGHKVLMIDMNGDGIQDQVDADQISGDWYLKVYFGKQEGGFTPYGFEPPYVYNWPATFDRERVTHNVGSGNDRMLFDFNGDGLPDLVERGTAATLVVYFNLGTRFDTSPTSISILQGDDAYVTRISGSGETKIDFIDINGDGLPDRVHWDTVNTNPWKVQFNLGTNLATASSISNLPTWSTFEGPIRHVSGGRGKTNVDMYDWDGDGLMDWVDARNSPWKIKLSKPGGKPNAMVVAKNGLGGELRVRYEPSTKVSDNTGVTSGVDDHISKLPFPTWLVTLVRKSDGTCTPPSGDDGFDPLENECIQQGKELFQRITYEGGYFDPLEREFRGFRAVEVERAQAVDTGSETVAYTLTRTEFSQEKETAGKKLLVQQYAKRDGTLVQEEQFAWEKEAESSGAFTRVWLEEQRSRLLAPLNDTVEQCLAMENEPPDDYNRILTTCTLPCGGATAGSCAGSVAGQLTTRTVWHDFDTSDPAAAVRDKPACMESFEGSSTTTACEMPTPLVKKTFAYDDQANLESTATGPASVSTPNPTTVTVLTDPDGYGNVQGVTDGNGNLSSYDFTTGFKLYPAKETRPTTGGVAHETLFQYALAFGQVTQVTDENGEETKRVYDGLGRVVCEALPGDSCNDPETATRRYRYHYAVPEGSFEQRLSYVEVLQRQCTGGGGGTCTEFEPDGGFSKLRVYVDALGRERATVSERVVEGVVKRVVEKHVRFDTGGRVVERFSTYTLADTGPFTESEERTSVGLDEILEEDEEPSTKTTYLLNGDADFDPLGRPHTVARAGNDEMTTFTYSGTETTAEGPGALKAVSLVDDRGNEVKRDLYEGSAIDLTYEYEFDAMSRLEKTKVGGALIKTFGGYDMFDRPTQVIDEDSGVSVPTPAPGTWLSAFDANGNQVLQNDAKAGQQVQLCYDALNRITRRLLLTGSASYATSHCSGSPGSGVTLESSYTYDATTPTTNSGIGRLATATDLAGSESFEYDLRGQVTRQSRTVSGSTATMRFAYDAGGRLSEIEYPDGEDVEYLYQHDGLPIGIQSPPGSPSTHYVTDVQYDVFGRVSRLDHGNSIRDSMVFHDETENFRLNHLLVRMTGTSPPPAIIDLTHSYNSIGKLEGIDDVASGDLSNDYAYQYDGLGRLWKEDWGPGTTYDDLDLQYDSHGNLSKKAGQVLSYHATKLHQVTDHGSLIDGPIGYDDNGQRTQKATPSKAEVYTYNALGQLTRTDFGPTPSSLPDHAEYAYDYAGRRVQKQLFYGTTGQPILRTYSRFADDQGTGTRTKYYFLGDRLVAARQTTSSFSSTGPAWWRSAPEPIQIPPLVALGLVGGVLFLLVVAPDSGRRPVRILVAVAPARAAAMAVILVVGGLPAPLFAQTPPPITHYHLDRLGSVLAVTDATGAVVQQNRYRAYGEIRGRFDGGGTPVAESERYRHEYTAWETDVGTSLLYAGTRYYDPSLGQFLTHDPAAQFASPYALGPGDPVNTADPTGAASGDDEVDDEASAEETEDAAETESVVKEGASGTTDSASVATDDSTNLSAATQRPQGKEFPADFVGPIRSEDVRGEIVPADIVGPLRPIDRRDVFRAGDDVAGLDPYFMVPLERTYSALKAEGWNPRVADGPRTLDEQKDMVKTGRSRTLNSKHLKGQAADLYDRRFGSGNMKFFDALGSAAGSSGLIWGGNWKTFVDKPHVEM